ncbi:hypothetical protein ACH42_14455 [Endozoicomonas sp. (ex Bugula neritina AB1)]|nr:hypothetical protein ACH42_14455 [Endozoicomonas sp. (ex Bugula neritina AB1)]
MPSKGVKASDNVPRSSVSRYPGKVEPQGQDDKSRKVTKTTVKSALPSLLDKITRWKPLHARKNIQPHATSYHHMIGHHHEYLEPSINNQPFSHFWEPAYGIANYTDTVDHRVMKVRNFDELDVPIDGIWHVKSPGKESRQTRFKRFIQKLIYHVTGQDYKGRYYNDHKLLAQKEVLATNLYRAVVLEDSDPDMEFEKQYQCGYSYDEEQDRHCVATRHLEGYKDASTLFQQGVEGAEWRIFDERHNPAADLVIRRFFLGDEDYLKLDNYMYKTNDDPKARTRMYCIDFGMSFYNMFHLPQECTYEQFKYRLLSKSGKHKVQYSGQPTMMTVIDLMSSGQVESGIRGALEKIARMSDELLEKQCWQIHNLAAREAMLALLKNKRQQARAILEPLLEVWPKDFGREVSDGLVAHPTHRS